MKYLILFLFTLNAYAIPYHCSPNPPDGTYYVDGVIYDNPKPKECYSVMKNDDEVIQKKYLKFDGDKFIEDSGKVLADLVAENTKKSEKETEKARIKSLAKKDSYTAAEIKEALVILLKKIDKE